MTIEVYMPGREASIRIPEGETFKGITGDSDDYARSRYEMVFTSLGEDEGFESIFDGKTVPAGSAIQLSGGIVLVGS